VSPDPTPDEVAMAGHRGDEATARSGLVAVDPRTRVAALGALARLGALTDVDLAAARSDLDVAVRRRAAEEAGRTDVAVDLLAMLGDEDGLVVEAAAWACGERRPPPEGAVEALARVAVDHEDPLCREAAVAALGAIGDPAGLDAILAATSDKPAVRRRAVIALAPFEGPDVDTALQRALEDRDRQVRQAAEDLLEG
jgi:HEAT repeat protein